MKYHKQQIFRRGVFLFIGLVICLVNIVMLYFFIRYHDADVFLCVIPIGFLAYFGYSAFFNAKRLSEVLQGYKTVKESGLLQKLKSINPYPTDAEMMAAVRQEKKQKIYEDHIIFMTESFLGADNIALLIDGILDAQVIIYKTNGFVTKVVLVVLYYNGKKIKAVYHRSLDLPTSAKMQAQADSLEYVTALLAKKGKLFRKYDCCRLIGV